MSEEERHPFLPEQDYETDMTTYDFIYFVQDYSPFLREYLDYLYDSDDPEDIDDHGYYTSFIDICNEIDTDIGDDGTFETYRATVEPFMEFITEECGQMNAYYEESMREIPEEVDSPKGVASRTRSNRPASGFEIPPSKRGRNAMTLGPIKQDGVRIKLSDGQEYTYGELKHMWDWNKTMTPYRHPYTAEDKQKINDLLDLATKGGKKTNKRKSNKRKSNTKKTNKRKSNKRKSNKRKSNKRKSNK
jgi:hypothetical protein